MIITLKLTELCILIMLAVTNDFKTYKIRNTIVFPFMMAGIITNILNNGAKGLVYSLIGTSVPILALILLFQLRMLGAGDLKLFAAIGSIMGAKFVLYAIAYSFLSGGAMALFIMLINKNYAQRFKYLINYLKNCILSCCLLPYEDFSKKEKGTYFRFSYAAACGTMIQIFCAANLV